MYNVVYIYNLPENMECSKIYVHLNDVFRRVHIYMFSLAQDDYIVCLCVIIMIYFLDSSTEVVACLMVSKEWCSFFSCIISTVCLNLR